MSEVTTIGVDLAKNVFQLHGVTASGAVVIRRQLRRRQVLRFFEKQPPCLVGMEACASSHYWARAIAARGHEVKLMPARYVKAYVKRNKTDAADAEAICEAVTRPTMRFVAVKSAEQQSVLMLHRTRELLVRQRTMLVNAIRAHMAEFGVVARTGLPQVAGLSLAYFVAQTVPNRITLRWMNKLGMSEAAHNPKSAMDAIVTGRGANQGLAARLGIFLLSHRHLALAVCLNLPGNSVIGGGGGIAALCGLTRQFNWWGYVSTLIVATAPLPLVVLIGLVEIEPMLERHGILHDLLSGAASIFLHE